MDMFTHTSVRELHVNGQGIVNVGDANGIIDRECLENIYDDHDYDEFYEYDWQLYEQERIAYERQLEEELDEQYELQDEYDLADVACFVKRVTDEDWGPYPKRSRAGGHRYTSNHKRGEHRLTADEFEALQGRVKAWRAGRKIVQHGTKLYWSEYVGQVKYRIGYYEHLAAGSRYQRTCVYRGTQVRDFKSERYYDRWSNCWMHTKFSRQFYAQRNEFSAEDYEFYAQLGSIGQQIALGTIEYYGEMPRDESPLRSWGRAPSSWKDRKVRRQWMKHPHRHQQADCTFEAIWTREGTYMTERQYNRAQSEIGLEQARAEDAEWERRRAERIAKQDARERRLCLAAK